MQCKSDRGNVQVCDQLVSRCHCLGQCSTASLNFTNDCFFLLLFFPSMAHGFQRRFVRYGLRAITGTDLTLFGWSHGCQDSFSGPLRLRSLFGQVTTAEGVKKLIIRKENASR